MEEEKLKHFIENMRMAGQPDDMIAESLIDAGNNKLVVLNAFGVSSVEELREQPEEESEDENSTPMPMVDTNGNIMFGTQESPTEPGDILKPAPEGMPVETSTEATEDHIEEPKPESQAGERVYPRPAPREAKVEHVTVPERPDEDEELEEKMQTPRPEAPDAFELHGGGFIAIPIKRSREKPDMLKHLASPEDDPKDNDDSDSNEDTNEIEDTHDEVLDHADTDETDTSDEKPEEDAHKSDDDESHHAHHHTPHTYAETMEDVTDHEELEPGFEGQVESDTSEDEDSKNPDDEDGDEHEDTNDSSDKEDEPEMSDEPIRRLETAFQEKEKELDKKLGAMPPKLAPEETEPETDPELPQEIEVTELEAIPSDDTHELQQAVKEDVADAVAEAPKQPVHQAKTVDAAPVPTAPEMQHAGDTAKSILGNVWLKVSLIVLVVAILVLLAISVMTRVSDGLSFSG